MWFFSPFLCQFCFISSCCCYLLLIQRNENFLSFYWPLGSSFLPSLIALGVELGYLFDFSPVSWVRLVSLWAFPLALLLLNPIGFGLLSFHFHLFQCIFWFLFWFLLWFVGYSEGDTIIDIDFGMCPWQWVLRSHFWKLLLEPPSQTPPCEERRRSWV